MKSKKTVFRLYLTIERDEQFINEMAADGWKLTKITLGWWYKFEKCKPGEYICRAMYTNAKEREGICELLTENGAEIIKFEDPFFSGMYIFAVRKSDLGEFELLNTIDSRMAEYNTKIKTHFILGSIFVLLGVILTWLGVAMSISVTLICGIVELAVGALIMAPGIYYIVKYRKLKKEREIAE